MSSKTLSELMLFNTVKLVAEDGSSGTGFFFSYEINGIYYPILITNKHVVNFQINCKMKFWLHLKDENGEPSDNVQISYTTDWMFHSDKDICFCFVNPLFEYVVKVFGKDVYYTAIDESKIATLPVLNSLTALEEVTMVGYPNGLWDEMNNLPIFRRGYTASHPKFDFNKSGIGLVDMACYPGSSGSPIFIHNENGYSDRNGTMHLGAKRIILLGVLFEGPRYNASGEITINPIPMKNVLGVSTPTLINLGYYIKSIELLEFKQHIKKTILGESTN